MQNFNIFKLLSKTEGELFYKIIPDLPKVNMEDIFYIKQDGLPLFENFLDLAKKEYLQNPDNTKIINFFTKNEYKKELTLSKIINLVGVYNLNVEPKKYVHMQMIFLTKYLLYLYGKQYILFPLNKNFYYKNIPLDRKKIYLFSSSYVKLLEAFLLNDSNADSNTITSIYKIILCINLNKIKELNNENIFDITTSMILGNGQFSVRKVFKEFCILNENENITLVQPSVALSIELCRSKVMIPIEYVGELPVLNNKLEFLISDKLNTKEFFLKEWTSFIKTFTKIENRSIENYLLRYTSLNPNNFDDLKHLIQYYAYIIELNYRRATSLERHVNLIYRFLIFLVAKAKILFPIISKYYLTQTTAKYRLVYYQTNRKSKLYSQVDKLKKYNGSGEYTANSKENQLSYLLRMFSSLNSEKYQNIKIEDLDEYRANLIQSNYFSSDGHVSNIVFSLQRYLKNNLSLHDMPYPSDSKYGRISDSLNKYRNDDQFGWIDGVHENRNLMKEVAIWYINFRKIRERKTIDTVKGDVNSINHYFDWLFDKYPRQKYTADFIYKTFDYLENEMNCYPEYLAQGEDSGSTISTKINVPIRMFRIASQKKFKNLHGCVDDLSGMAVPRDIGKSPRKNMDMVIYLKALDILMNRPPSFMNNFWKIDKDKAHMEWWKHNVYPALPISLVLMLIGAQRSSNILNLCREKSFYFEGEELKKVIINTDKSTKRKEMPKIQNAWDYFESVLIPFRDWHIQYFPKMQKIKYKNDNNTVWPDYIPIMNTPNFSKPMERATLARYWKRTLCHIQLELNNVGLDFRVAWNKKGDFFKSTDEIDKLSNTHIDTIEAVYNLHSIRGSALTYYSKSGFSPIELMDIGGHQSFDMIYDAYLDIDEEGLTNKLKHLSNNYNFNSEQDMPKFVNNMIGKELIPTFIRSNNSYLEVAKLLEEKGLFFLDRTIDGMQEDKHGKGYVKTHPATWKWVDVGICPGVSCPYGHMKCSLCPYLITGVLFIKGIISEINRVFILFNKILNDLKYYREHNDVIPAKRLSEEFESILKEIIGWIDVVEKISDLFNTNSEENEALNSNMIISHKAIIGIKSIPKDIGILEYYTNAAKEKNVTIDTYIRDYVSRLALVYSVKQKNSDEIQGYIHDDQKMIDFLVESYEKKKNTPMLLGSFISHIKS